MEYIAAFGMAGSWRYTVAPNPGADPSDRCLPGLRMVPAPRISRLLPVAGGKGLRAKGEVLAVSGDLLSGR